MLFSSCVGVRSGGLSDASFVLENVALCFGGASSDLVLAQCAVWLSACLPSSLVDRLRRMLAHVCLQWQAMSPETEV